jgi:hypothetical protein
VTCLNDPEDLGAGSSHREAQRPDPRCIAATRPGRAATAWSRTQPSTQLPISACSQPYPSPAEIPAPTCGPRQRLIMQT